MKKTSILVLSLAFISLTIFAVAVATKWSFDKKHQKIAFSISHLTISDVEGYFKDVDATITSSKPDFSDAVAEMTIKTASINTDDEDRDKHLCNEDFFDAPKYPTITFKSTSFKKGRAANQYIITGNLTMHGVTKSISLIGTGKTAVNPYSKTEVVGFKLRGKLNRYDFNLGKSTPNAILGTTVFLTINAEFNKI